VLETEDQGERSDPKDPEDPLDAEETLVPKERLVPMEKLELTERQEIRATKDTKVSLACQDLRVLWENKDDQDHEVPPDPEAPTVTVVPLALTERQDVTDHEDLPDPVDPPERTDAEAEPVKLDQQDPLAHQDRVCTPAPSLDSSREVTRDPASKVMPPKRLATQCKL